MLVLRLEPSWKIPIYGGLYARPAAGIADAGGEALATGMLTVGFDHRHFSLWAGGKYGDEVRPAYLDVPVVYDLMERIPYGAWAGVSVNATDGVRTHLAYSMDRLKQPGSGTQGTESTAHTLALGIAATF